MVAAALLGVAVSSTPKAQAANLTWNQTGAGPYSWADSANWGGAGFPNAIGDVANLSGALAGAQTVNLNAVITLGDLNFGATSSAAGYTLAAGTNGLLILDGSAGSASINKLSGSPSLDTISADIQFNDALTISNNSGGGTLTFLGTMRSLTADITITGTGVVAAGSTITGIIATAGGFIKDGAGIMQTNASSTYAGTTWIKAGRLIMNTGASIPIRSAIIIDAGAILEIKGVPTWASIAGAGNVTNTTATARIISMGRDDTSTSFTGTITSTTALNIAITKIGAGILTLAPSAASTYTGNTIINGGGIVLDFANAGALTSLLAATPLQVTGGNFTMKGKAGLAASQTLGALTVGATGGSITLIAGDASGTTLKVGTVTATASGGAVLIVDSSASTALQMGTAYTALALNNRFVFSDGTANTFNWATNTAANADTTGFSTYTALPVAGGGANTTAYNLTASQNQTTAVSTIRSLKLGSTSASKQTLDLVTFSMTLGGGTTATPGAILIDGTDNWDINGSTGALKSAHPSAAGDLIFHQYSTGTVTVNAGIADNATVAAAVTNLVKAGTGTLVLGTTGSGTNTFTGAVFVNGGTLSFSSVTAAALGSLGNGVTSAVAIRDGATLRYTGATGTIAATLAGSHTFLLAGGNATIDVATAATTDALILSGVISGAGGLTKAGIGILRPSAASTYTGPTFVTAGTLQAGITVAAFGSSSSPLNISAGATVDLNALDQTIGSLSGAGTITNSSTSAKTLTLGGANLSTTFTGSFTNGTATTGQVLTKVGTGILILAGSTTSTWTGNHSVNGGVLRLTASNLLAATVPMYVANAAGPAMVELSSGVAQTVGSLSFGGTAGAASSQGTVLIGSSATLTLGGNVTYTSTGNPLPAYVSGAGGLSLGSTTRTFTIGDSASVGAAEAELTISTPISGTTSILKTGFGNLLLSAANTYGGATTQLTAGGLTLDYTTQNNNKIPGANSLTLNGGGNLFLRGNASASTSQDVLSTTLASGGFSTVTLTPGSSQKIVFNMGAFTRAASAGTIRFNLPTGTQDATNGIRTATTNVNGILGGWATVTNVSGATNFAANDGSGGVVLVTSAGKSDVTTWSAMENVSDGASGYSGILSQNFGLNSLRFNSAADSAVTIADGRVLTILSGGVLQTSAASGSTVSPTLAGGRLISGTSSELIFTADVTTAARALVVSSAIGGAHTLTKTGDGVLKLSGINDFTGVTYLKAGTLQVAGGNAIGDSSLVNISTTRSSVFELLGNETIGGILGGNGAQGGVSTIALVGNTLRIIQGSDQTYSGFFSGTGTLVKDGPSALNLNINSSTTFTGPLEIIGGQLRLSGSDVSSGRIGSTVITVANPGSQLHINHDNNNSPDRIVDSAIITLSNTAPGLGLFFRDSENSASNSETIGSVILGAGHNVIAADYTGSTATRFGTLTVSGTWNRSNNATTLVVGRNLGSVAYGLVAIAATGGRIVTTLTPSGANAPVGGGSVDGTTTGSIFPFMIGQATTAAPTAADVGNSFVRHNAGRLRPLSTTSGVDAEYVFDASGFNLLADSTASNVRFTATPGATLNVASATTRTINALAIDSSLGAVTVTGPGTDTLVLTSGALLSTGAAANNTALTGFAGITTATNNEYIVYVTNNQFTLGSPLTTSAAALTKSGAGVLVLSGLTGNTYTGGTFFNQGLIEASTLADLGPSGNLNFFGGGLRWATGATFDLSARTVVGGSGGAVFDTNGNNVTFANAFTLSNSGTGALTKDGAGVLTLNAASTLTGGTNVNAGTLALGASSAIGTGALTLANNAGLTIGAGSGVVNQTVSQLSGAITNTIVGGDVAVSILTVNQSTTTTYAGSLGGAGANQNSLGLTKSGVGGLTLSGATLSYAGPTVVNGGTLNLAGSGGAALATSAVTVARGATLNLVNTAGQAVNLGSGVLTLGASGTGSTVLGLELGSLTAYDRINSTAAAVVSGEVVLNLTGLSGSGIGDYDLLTAASGLTLGGATYALGSLTGVVGGARALTSSDTFVRLSVTAFTSDLYWSNALSDGNWSANSLFSSNFATDLAGTNANGLPGVNDRVIFSANTAGSPTIATTLNANFNIKDLEFAANPSGVTSVSIAPGTLTPGILTLTPAVATDGIDVASNAGVIAISAPLALGANQRWAVDGTGLNGSSLTVSGAISGAFNLEKNGAGILTLSSAASTYSGTTTVADGVLQAGIAQGLSNASAHIIQAAGILRLNNFDATIGSLAGAGTVENAGAANARTLTTGGDNSSTTFSGTLQNGGAFALALAKTGTGSLTLSGANTNTGNITVNGGVLNVTGTWTGNTTSSTFVYGGTSTSNSVANVSNNMSLFGHTGSNVALGVSVYNQTAGTVDVTGNTTSATYVANAAGSYSYFNLTGGTFKSRTRFGYGISTNLATPSRSVVYIGGTGRLDQTGGEWMLNYSNAQITIAAGGELDRTGATQPFGLIMPTTTAGGEYAVLNVAGGSLVTTTQPFKFGNSGTDGAGNTAIINLAAGTLQVGAAMTTSLPSAGANLAYLNFAGGTLKTAAAVANWIPLTASGITFTSNFYGAIDNSALAGAPSFTGGLTFDTNGFSSSLGAVLQGASGSGVAQSSLTITGGSNYIGAPEVVFTGGTLESGGSPATGYALINAGAVVGIVITSPGAYSSAPTVTLTGGGGTGATVSVGTLAANTSGGLTKIGTGTLTLSGANTYAGGTAINLGTLALGASNVLADAGNVTIAGGTLDIATFNDSVATVSLRGGAITGTTGVLTSTAAFDLRNGSVSAILAGSVGLNKTTADTVTLSKANTYSGVTAVTAGTLAFSAANNLGDASATNTLSLNGATLSYTGSGSANLAANQVMTVGSSGATLNASDATGILNLQGGIVTSAAANLTKTGLGAVAVTGSTNLNGGNVTVSAGALNLGFTANGAGALAVAAGATLNLYDGAATSMTVTGLTLAAGSSLGFDLGATGVNDVLSLTGTAVIAPSVSLNFNALSTLGAGSYNLLSVSTGTLNAADYVLGLAPSGLNYNFTTINAGQTLQLTTSVLNLVYWKGDVGGSWSSNNASDTNWASDLAGLTDLGALPIATDTLVFSSSGAVGTTFTTTLDGSFTADSLKFTDNPVGVTAVSINQGSSGTLTLSPASANNGISVPANVGAITIGAPIATGATQTWEVVGGGANGSSLTVSGAVTIGHVINKTGAGVLTLSGSNTGSGGINFAAGTLVIGNANALGAGTFSIGAGTTVDTGAAAIVNAGNNVQNWNGNFTFTGTNALNLGTGVVTLGDNVITTISGQTLTVGGAIGDGVATFGLTKSGVGALTLNGTNTYGGLTNLVNGALTLSGDNSGAAGGVTVAAGTALNLGHANGLGSGTLTFNGGTLDNTSGGALTLGGNGAQTWNTGFTFNGTNNLAMGSGAVTLGANIPVTVTAGNLTVNGVIDDGLNTFNLEMTGAGTLTFGALNTYGGATTISAGTLAFTANQTLAAATNTLLFGASAASTTPGNLVLTADATFGGAMIVNTNSATASQISIGSGKTLTFNANVQIGATTPAVASTVTKLTLNGGGVFNVTTAAAGTFTVGGSTSTTLAQDTTLDLTALVSTTINTSATGTLRVNPSGATNLSGAKATLLLPAPVVADTVATATITAGTIAVGNAGLFATQAGQINTIRLGTGLTTLNADTLNVGTGARDIGQIIYGQAGGDLKMRAADGTSRATLFAIGTGGASTGTTESTTNNLVDLSTHDANILVTTLNVGNQARTGNLISEFKFGAGDSSLASVLDATSVNIGFRTGTATTISILTNRVNISGGAVTFGNGAGSGTGVKIGSSTYDQAGVASTIGELNISGGTVLINNSTALAAAVQLVTANASAGGGTVTASMNLTGGTTTLGGHIIGNATALRTTSTVTLNGASAILNMGGKNIGSASALITFNAQAGTLRNLAQLNGGGVLTKSTTGTLLLDTANTFTGGVTLSAAGGKVIAGHSNALGSGTITLNSNTVLELADGITLSNAFVATAQGNAKTIQLQSGATSAAYSGNITNSEEVAANFDLNASAGGTLTVSGNISSGDPAAGFEKTGAGTVILSGANTFTGVTTVSMGKLVISSLGNGVSASSLGTAGLAPANLVFATGVTLGYVGAGETSARGFTVNDGVTLDASGTGALAFSSAAKVAFANSTATRSLTLDGTSTGANSFGAGLSVGGTLDADKINLIVKNGVGTWIIANGETLKSTAQIDVNVGLLGLAGGVLPSAGRVDLATGTTLRMETGNTDDLGSRIQLDAGAAVTLAVSSDVSFATALTVAGAGSAAVTKSGAGKLTLSADNSAIAGGFTVAQGTLDVTNTLGLGAANATVNGGRLAVNAVIANTVNVASGATVGGGGTVAVVNVVSSAKLSPGNPLGTLTAGNATMFSGSIFEWQVQDTADVAKYDHFNVTGTLNLSNASSANRIVFKVVSLLGAGDGTALGNPLNFDTAFSAAPAAQRIKTFSLGTVGSVNLGANANINDVFSFDVTQFTYSDGSTSNAGLWSIDWNSTTGAITLTAVPEPSTYGFGLGALALAAAAIRRRKRQATKA
jgi:autotransporter-associated beta strand protein